MFVTFRWWGSCHLNDTLEFVIFGWSSWWYLDHALVRDIYTMRFVTSKWCLRVYDISVIELVIFKSCLGIEFVIFRWCLGSWQLDNALVTIELVIFRLCSSQSAWDLNNVLVTIEFVIYRSCLGIEFVIFRRRLGSWHLDNSLVTIESVILTWCLDDQVRDIWWCLHHPDPVCDI